MLIISSKLIDGEKWEEEKEKKSINSRETFLYYYDIQNVQKYVTNINPIRSMIIIKEKWIKCVRGAQTAFAEKYELLTQAHELTTSRREAWHLSFILYLSLL
jgi:hypothetical protein